jgi:autotransporter passenger strand-loop-strand repeat protein
MGIDNFDGGVACRTMISSGGTENVLSGTAIGTKILNCGFEFISAGGTDIGTQIISWGSQKIGSGGTGSNAVVYGGAYAAGNQTVGRRRYRDRRDAQQQRRAGCQRRCLGHNVIFVRKYLGVTF